MKSRLNQRRPYISCISKNRSSRKRRLTEKRISSLPQFRSIYTFIPHEHREVIRPFSISGKLISYVPARFHTDTKSTSCRIKDGNCEFEIVSNHRGVHLAPRLLDEAPLSSLDVRQGGVEYYEFIGGAYRARWQRLGAELQID